MIVHGQTYAFFILLECEDVVTDLDAIPFTHGGLTVDAGPVDLDTVVTTQILQQDLTVTADDLGVPARDVPLRQPDGVPFLPADGDFVSDQWYDGGLTFVVLDD